MESKEVKQTKDWTNKSIKRSHPFYATCMTNFGKQYKNIKQIDRVFINDNNKVFAAEWRDLKDVFNMIGGIYPDIKKTIEFVD